MRCTRLPFIVLALFAATAAVSTVRAAQAPEETPAAIPAVLPVALPACPAVPGDPAPDAPAPGEGDEGEPDGGAPGEDDGWPAEEPAPPGESPLPVPPGHGAQVSLRVNRIMVPPGAIAQVHIEITEPAPIMTGGGIFSFDAFDSIDGIALSSPDGDVYGVAVVRGTQVALSFVSPSGTFGTDSDYPALTIAARVPETAAPGTRFPLVLDGGSLRFLDAAGRAYTTEVENGYVQVGDALSIGDVIPGSATVPSGSTITILGTGFQRDTRIQLKETKIRSTTYVSPERIDVVLARRTTLHGMGLRARNDDERAYYYSYHRTTREVPSKDPVLGAVVPVFPDDNRTAAELDVALDTLGIALQNIGETDAVVTAELVGAGDRVLGSAQIQVSASRFVVLGLVNLFGFQPQAADVVRIRSEVPVQVMGVIVDGAGNASPQIPR